MIHAPFIMPCVLIRCLLVVVLAVLIFVVLMIHLDEDVEFSTQSCYSTEDKELAESKSSLRWESSGGGKYDLSISVLTGE
jgi:hypothetical protein